METFWKYDLPSKGNVTLYSFVPGEISLSIRSRSIHEWARSEAAVLPPDVMRSLAEALIQVADAQERSDASS